MNTHYEQTLYPLQDRILAAIDSTETIFYLTGGTPFSELTDRNWHTVNLAIKKSLYEGMREMFCHPVDRVLLKVFAGMSYSSLRLKKTRKEVTVWKKNVPIAITKSAAVLCLRLTKAWTIQQSMIRNSFITIHPFF